MSAEVYIYGTGWGATVADLLVDQGYKVMFSSWTTCHVCVVFNSKYLASLTL